MGLSQQIRALLMDGVARTPKQIYGALGSDPVKTGQALANMKTKGLTIQDKSTYPASYTLGRIPPEKLSLEELRRRERDRKRVARLAAGGRRLVDIQAERAAATKQRVLAAKVNAVKETPKKPKPISITPKRPSVIEPTAVKPVLPDTSAWLAANPGKLIRLEPGRWSTDLRFQY